MLSKNAKIAELFDIYDGYLVDEKIFIETEGNTFKQLIYKPNVTMDEIKYAIFEVEKAENTTGINVGSLELPEELVVEKVNEAVAIPIYESDFEILNYGESGQSVKMIESIAVSEDTTINGTQEYLKDIGVTNNIINWAMRYRNQNIERLSTVPEEVKSLIPSLNIKWLGEANVMEKALISVMLRQPLNLKGDAATGKTTFIKTLAQILHLPLYIVNGSVEAKKSTFVGEYVVERNEMVVKRGQLTLAMDRNYYGGILYIDEINMLKPDVLSLINPVTDGSGYFYNDVEKKNIYMHEDFYFASAMNFATYAGTKKLNIATFDRTAAITLKIPNKKTVKSLITQHSIRINTTLKEQGFKEIEEYDVANLTDVYMQLITSNLSAESKSFRNIVLMLNYITTIGYANAFGMWLDKIQSDAERAKVVGVLTQNDLLNRVRVQPTELI